MKQQKHSIDFLFTLVLLFIFVCSALVVLLFSANTYEHVVQTSSSSFESGTSLAYVTQKIRQNDAAHQISIESFHGQDALTIKETYNENTYITYIYEHNGGLYELFAQEDVSVSPDNGTFIMEITDFSMKEIKPGLFEFVSIAADGSRDSVIIGTHSE